MSVIALSDAEALYDLLLCFSAGFVTAAAYCFLTELFPFKGDFLMLVWHVVFFAASGLLFFCFVLGVTACKEPRWHLAVGFVSGVSVCAACLSSALRGAAGLVRRLVLLLLTPITLPLKKLASACRGAARRLQTAAQARYNRREDRKRSRAEARDGKQEKREPKKAAKET